MSPKETLIDHKEFMEQVQPTYQEVADELVDTLVCNPGKVICFEYDTQKELNVDYQRFKSMKQGGYFKTIVVNKRGMKIFIRDTEWEEPVEDTVDGS